jgi:hypothetical protein
MSQLSRLLRSKYEEENPLQYFQSEALKQSLPENVRNSIGAMDIKSEPGEWYSETYPVGETGAPDELGNVPYPGGVEKLTIGIRPKGRNLPFEEQQRMVLGETLHVLDEYSPEFKTLKDSFDETTLGNPESLDYMQEMYMNHRNHPKVQEKRDFDKWYEMSGRDSLLRGRLTPDKNDEFRNYPYTKEQEDVLSGMNRFIYR